MSANRDEFAYYSDTLELTKKETKEILKTKNTTKEILKSMQYAKHMLIVDSSKLILQKNLE